MPIKDYVSGEVQYLTSYTPFAIIDGVESTDFIDQMISIDLQPMTTPTVIDYYIGAATSYSNMLTLKNLTQNTTLTGLIEFNKEFFVVHEQDRYIDTVNSISFTLVPEETRQFIISVKNKSLNNTLSYSSTETKISVSIKNIVTDQLVLKRSNVVLLEPKMFPQNITVK